MKFGVAIFPTEAVQPPAELARMAEERGFESLLFPEHTHIPAARATPIRAAASCRLIQPDLRPVRRADRGGGRDRAAADRDRDLPGDRARPDHHRQGGRVGRPPVRRPVPVRRRRRLECRGDAQPRDRRVAAVRDDARADRGDEGDLDARTRRATRAGTSTSSGSGAGPSRCRSRTRRCSSAATGRACSTACSRLATSGCPTGVGRRIIRPGLRRCSARRGGRPGSIPMTVAGMMRGRGADRALERAASTAACSGFRRTARTRSRRRSTATLPAIESVPAGRLEVAAGGGERVGREHLHHQRGPGEVDRAHAAARVRVVVLAQPLREHGGQDPVASVWAC